MGSLNESASNRGVNLEREFALGYSGQSNSRSVINFPVRGIAGQSIAA
jgi:hypothetical protein